MGFHRLSVGNPGKRKAFVGYGKVPEWFYAPNLSSHAGDY